jgi:hypothetical protein
MRPNIRLISMLIPLLFCAPLAAVERSPAAMEALLAAGVSGEALDKACGVRDCADIRLFWYTDLEEAKKVAGATGKPILSLRLMGRLDEEFSCANSRFFRTAFYKDKTINKLLRDRFVLHWRSVRPVPKVTIDFGDGSRLERTLTGNSIHYVLDSKGRLVDALPGLSGPDSFEKALEDADQAARQLANLDDRRFQVKILERRYQQFNARIDAFRQDLAVLAPDSIKVGGNETASKAATEDPILRALRLVSNEDIDRLAKLRRPRIHLDASSKTFLIRKQGVTDPQEAERLVDNFEAAVARDEVLNEYKTGPAILNGLFSWEILSGNLLETFNDWVYQEVFKAPLSDPWLGLAPDDVYTALPAGTRTAERRP